MSNLYTLYTVLYCRLVDGRGGRGECSTPCKKGEELSGMVYVHGNMSRGKCPDPNGPTNSSGE